MIGIKAPSSQLAGRSLDAPCCIDEMASTNNIDDHRARIVGSADRKTGPVGSILDSPEIFSR
ncbi:MAG: hypothetical protein WC816_00735 [Sphingomonas sp.]